MAETHSHVNPIVIDITSPLSLHPSDGSNSISVEKLLGAGNYRSWRRSIEIGFA